MFGKIAKILRVELRSADVDEFWPPPLIPRSARIPVGARPGLQDRRSSSQHLMVGVHTRSATRAQALQCGAADEAGSDDRRRPVSIGPAQSSGRILAKSARDVVEKCLKIFVRAGLENP